MREDGVLVIYGDGMSQSLSQHEINRRELLRWAVIASTMLTPIGKSLAATPAQVRVLLGRPTDSSIAISVMSSKKVKAFVEYGFTKTKYSERTSTLEIDPGVPVIFDLVDLRQDATIFYRVSFTEGTSKTVIRGKQSSFVTQRKVGSSFVFTAHGDTHPERKGKMFNESLYKVTLANILTHKPDFHVMMGDDFSIDPLIAKGQANRANVEKVYLTHRQWLEAIGPSVPLFLVNGNHEQAAAYLLDGTLTNPAVLAGSARVKYFPLPAPDGFYTGDKVEIEGVGLLRDYYAWEWGNALFVVLDPYWHSKKPVDNVAGDSAGDTTSETATATKKPKNQKNNQANTGAGGSGSGKTSNQWEIGIGDEQYFWLKETLEKSSAKFKFVFAHHVMGTGRGAIEISENYEWGGKDPKGTTTFKEQRPNWELPIHDLMVKNKVSIFFQGHDHIFVTQERDGLIYQALPNPADDTFTMFNESAYKSGVKAPNSGHIRVSVSTSETKVEYFLAARQEDSGRKNLQLAHSYTVKPK